MRKFASFAVVLIAFALTLSCSMSPTTESAVPSWDEYFAGAVYPVTVDGATRYLLEGDVLASNIDEVREYYDAVVADAEEDARSSVNLITVNRKKVMDVYNTTIRQNLTYTIDSAISAEVKTDLVWALGQWETYANVHFVDVTGTSTAPLFKLRNATATEEASMDGVIASAFFPSYAKKELILFADFYELFSNGGMFYGWDSKAVLVHELGHGIGLRHEFIWTASRKGWRQTGETSSPAQLLSTARDDYSIMFYPQYSAYKGDGRLSTADIAGVTYLYPAY